MTLQIPLSRRVLLGALAASAAPGLARASCDPQEVLFVCPAGTVKSAIAREMLKRRAAQAHIAVRVRSRGIEVQDHMSPALVADLRRDGINPAAEPARKFTAADLAPRAIVIVFDEAAQDPRLRGARVWSVPSMNADYSASKAALNARITALLAELRQRGSVSCGPAERRRPTVLPHP